MLNVYNKLTEKLKDKDVTILNQYNIFYKYLIKII